MLRLITLNKLIKLEYVSLYALTLSFYGGFDNETIKIKHLIRSLIKQFFAHTINPSLLANNFLQRQSFDKEFYS